MKQTSGRSLKRTWSLKAIFISFTVLALPAAAQQLPDADPSQRILLKDHCRFAVVDTGRLIATDQFQSAAFCLGYLTGFAFSVTALGQTTKICLPRTAYPALLAETYLKWIDASPAHDRLNDFYQVVEAMTSAYPCSAAKN
jgi:Rap1a immunity proteins